jgi:hypothetical protein
VRAARARSFSLLQPGVANSLQRLNQPPGSAAHGRAAGGRRAENFARARESSGTPTGRHRQTAEPESPRRRLHACSVVICMYKERFIRVLQPEFRLQHGKSGDLWRISFGSSEPITIDQLRKPRLDWWGGPEIVHPANSESAAPDPQFDAAILKSRDDLMDPSMNSEPQLFFLQFCSRRRFSTPFWLRSLQSRRHAYLRVAQTGYWPSPR